ncbi:MAG: Hsp70 family protein, partial [Pedobacter sp.]|nr:Hsp70 family protein [Pedobacter sp.]
ISLPQYNTIIQKDINKISVYLDEFMAKNEIKPEEIDSLFLTGGSSLVSGVQNLFKTKFPHISVTSGDNFTSVAKGLAYSGYLFED